MNGRGWLAQNRPYTARIHPNTRQDDGTTTETAAHYANGSCDALMCLFRSLREHQHHRSPFRSLYFYTLYTLTYNGTGIDLLLRDGNKTTIDIH